MSEHERDFYRQLLMAFGEKQFFSVADAWKVNPILANYVGRRLKDNHPDTLLTEPGSDVPGFMQRYCLCMRGGSYGRRQYSLWMLNSQGYGKESVTREKALELKKAGEEIPKNPRRRMTWEIAEEIRRRSGEMTIRQLAEEYMEPLSTIYRIVRGDIWKAPKMPGRKPGSKDLKPRKRKNEKAPMIQSVALVGDRVVVQGNAAGAVDKAQRQVLDAELRDMSREARKQEREAMSVLNREMKRL